MVWDLPASIFVDFRTAPFRFECMIELVIFVVVEVFYFGTFIGTLAGC